MRNLFYAAVILVLFGSCGSNSADKPTAEGDSADAAPAVAWEAVINDSTQRLEMKRSANAGPDSLSVPAVISFLNKANPDIKLELVKSSNDTLFLKIADAEHLTQRMGSTGPTMYFAAAVYNLTEVPGVRYVNFDFPEGDHAEPGTFGRDNFKDE
jgi:hypothetical protein